MGTLTETVGLSRVQRRRTDVGGSQVWSRGDRDRRVRGESHGWRVRLGRRPVSGFPSPSSDLVEGSVRDRLECEGEGRGVIRVSLYNRISVYFSLDRTKFSVRILIC